MIGRVISNGVNIPVLLGFLLFNIGSSSLNAEPIPVRILQFQQNRLYFDAGTESLIFENAPFVILSGTDTLYADFIERSDLGVCYSRPLDVPSDSLNADRLSFLITPATIDSTRNVIMFTSRFRPSLIQGSYTYSKTDNSPDSLVPITYAQRPDIRMLTLPYDPVLASRGPFADALFSIDSSSVPPLESEPFLEAPFIAVLIPNLNRPVNKNGLLTTSIYYRYNEQYLKQIFSSGDATPFNHLYAYDYPDNRLYSYDARQAERLFDRIRSKPKKLTISIIDPALESVGRFFADILARDRVKVEFTSGWSDQADLYLAFVELWNDEPTHTLIKLADRMLATQPSERLFTETLAQIDDKLETYQASADSSFKKRVLRQIDRMMQEDLGIFPLFRPSLYYAHTPDLIGMKFDRNNLPLFGQLVKVVLPPPPRILESD